MCIVGGSGDAESFGRLAALLAWEFAVVAYDRWTPPWRAVLAALGLPCTPPTFALARDPPQGELWFDDAS